MPPTTLLEEYQYDDDQTADLLSAIRQWNLAPRSQEYQVNTTITTSTSADTVHSADGSINSPPLATSSMTMSGVEFDAFTATSSTLSSSKKRPRTPSIKSNFSSRPSGITSRLLLDNFQFEKDHHDDPHDDAPRHHRQEQQEEDNELEQKPLHHKMKSQWTDNERDEVQSVQSLKDNTESKTIPDSNTLLLMETAKTLGLETDQLHLVLPTVKKLVQVVTQHVPHLEHFVETVTDTVLYNNEQDHDKNNNDKSQRKRNMSARREEMNQVLNILTADQMKAMTSLSSTQDTFKHKVEEKLFQPLHLHKMMELPMCAETPIKSNSSIRSSTVHDKRKTIKQEWSATEEDIMNEISRLVEFEEKYSKVHGITSIEETSDDDSTLQELLSADRTSLRRLVLHFAYLFSVKHDQALDKMNELYIFSHEATSLIEDLKKNLGLPDHSSIHSIARKVLGELDRRKKESFMK